jgi:F-type H+-transporting ATPase subunit b
VPAPRSRWPQLIDEARAEAARIIAMRPAKLPKPKPVPHRSAPRKPCATRSLQLAVAGAERILRKEINAQAHAELLTQLKSEL